jgi:hypothetical protein
VQSLEPAGATQQGRAYRGTFTCSDSGEYGFAVRVVPANDDLLSWTDIGLVSWASEDVADAVDGF